MLSECVLLILFKGNQAQEIIPLACLSLEVIEGPLSFNIDHLYYPYIQNPNMWFVHEISQSHKTGILTVCLYVSHNSFLDSVWKRPRLH